MKLKYLFAIFTLALALASCEDSSGTLGVDMMPTGDLIVKNYKTYGISTQSYPVGDSVLARSSISYLGRFTDPETGTTIKSDFLTQFHCTENFNLPDIIRGDSVTNIGIKLFISNFVGDSLATFKISAYELDKELDPNADYYTNIDPTKYYDTNKKPLTTKWFTISDRTISDSLRYANNKAKTTNISLSLPNEVGTKIIKAYREHPEYFKNTSTWIKSGLPGSKGFYFKLESGDGAVASIDICQMNLSFKYYDEGYKKDTTAMVQFAATEEVIQATRFENSNLDKLLTDTEATYIKSPAGIFTMATLPVDELSLNDTINSAKITFTRYNDKVSSNFRLGIPKNLLLVRLDDYLNGFFENYLLPDNRTSYITTYSSNTNTYTFNNVAKLVTKMLSEKRNGKQTENWNKVLLIPVEKIETTDDVSKSTIVVKLNHDFSMTSSRLVGGKNDKVAMEVIYTSFDK